MNQLNYKCKHNLVIVFLLMTFSMFAQKNTSNTSTNNTVGGNGGNIQATSFINNGTATISNSQSDLGTTNPLGFAINPNSVYNTGSVSQGPAGGNGNTNTVNNNSSSCPLMYTHVDIPFLQSCMQSTARVSYCNNGNATASNVYIDITLDPALQLDSATNAYTSLGANAYRFHIGIVVDSFCDGFDLYFTTSCDTALLGDTHCIDAHIYPDTVCSAVWNGFLLQSNGQCLGDSVSFTLQNNGPIITPSHSVRFVIIEDHLLINGTKPVLKQGPVHLLAGQSKDFILHNISPTKNYKLEILDANNQMLLSTSVNTCSAAGNAAVYNYNPNVLPNGSYLPSVSQGCNVNGQATVVARGSQDNLDVSQDNSSAIGNTTHQLELDDIEITAYPNPFSQYTTIQINKEVQTSILFRLYDLTGRIVHTKILDKQSSFELQKGQLTSGLYIFRMETLGEVLGTGKLMVK